MLRTPAIRRALAAAVLVLTGYVLLAGTVHFHAHGPVPPAPGWSAQDETTSQGGSTCLLCRFAQQPVAAEAVFARAGRPLTVPDAHETNLAQQPQQPAATSSRPRAPPAASSIS